MGILILAVFTLLIVGGVTIANRGEGEEDIEEAGDFAEKTMERLYYLEKYIELLQSDFTLGKVTKEDYEREKKALQNELHAIGAVIQLEEKQAYTSPEISEAGKLADNFFNTVGVKK